MFNLTKRNQEDISGTLKELKQHHMLLKQILTTLGTQLPPSALQELRSTEAELERVISQLTQEQVELAQLRALANTWSQINSSLELDTVLTQAMDQVIALTGAERGYILLKKPDSDELEFRVACSIENDPNDNNFQISRTVVNRVLETGEPLLTDNASEDAAIGNAKSVLTLALRSILCVPLKRRDNVIIGVVYVANRLRIGLFTKRELHLLSAFANQAAIAIENARVFTTVKTDLIKANEEVERLRIEIDHSRMSKQVEEIIDTDYFRYLQDMVQKMRDRGRTP